VRPGCSRDLSIPIAVVDEQAEVAQLAPDDDDTGPAIWLRFRRPTNATPTAADSGMATPLPAQAGI
jgi:hypothetical protein